MSSSIPTARPIGLQQPSLEISQGPQTPAQPTSTTTAPLTDTPPAKPSASEHILPEGLSSRRSSIKSARSDGTDGHGGHGGSDAAPVRHRSATPPRQSPPKATSRPSSGGGAGRVPDPHGSGEHIPMTPLSPSLDGGGSALALDARPSGGGAASIAEQRRSAATETEHASALPREAHDEIAQLTRGMPGAFPQPPAQVDHGPRAPGGLASLHAATVPSPRDVNPRIDLGALAQKLPDDITGCVAYMLSAMRKGPEDIPALEQLATRQAAVLQSRGIQTRDDFVAVLKQVQWRDTGTGLMHGMASASGFNLGSIPVNLKLADLTLGSLIKAMPQLPIALPALITGAVMGFALSALDVASGASAGKTFKDAYFTRPPEEQVPEPLASANPHTKTSMAVDNSLAAGIGYGGRNAVVRVPEMLNFQLKGQPQQGAVADGFSDWAGGLGIGGPVSRHVKNDFDVSAGRAGFQHFLARDDLGACLDHLQLPAKDQILSAAARAGAHVKNLKDTFPEALSDVFASKVGWTSHAILTAGFGGLTAMVASLPTTLQQNYGLSEKDANITTQMLKYVVLQALYHVWGGALGAVAGPRAPDTAAVSHA